MRVLVLGDPILKTVATPVTEFDEQLSILARDMHETMAAAPGIGLAAPQVGITRRMFVYNADPEGEDAKGSLCNPEITWVSDETIEMEEGCLSVPGQYFPVTRPSAVKVRAQEIDGSPVELDADGLLARIFQHEIDHLDGILFIDRLDPEVRKEAMRALRDQDFGMSPPPRKRRAL